MVYKISNSYNCSWDCERRSFVDALVHFPHSQLLYVMFHYYHHHIS